MKRAFPKKIKPIICSQSAADSVTESSRRAIPEVNRRARTSAAMISLALSMGASGVLLPSQDDGAIAAEPRTSWFAMVDGAQAPSAKSMSAQADWGSPTKAAGSVSSVIEHVVREGETLWRISRRYSVSVDSIVSANGLTSGAVLKVGQTLQISGASQTSSSTDAAVPVSAPVVAPNSTTSVVRASQSTVNRNLAQLQVLTISESIRTSLAADQTDALANLREKRNRLKISLAELQDEESGVSFASEPVDDLQRLTISQQAEVASDSATEPPVVSSQALFAEPTRTISSSSEQAQLFSNSTDEFVVYHVESGDTLGAIARKYQVSQEFIIKANQIEQPDRLVANQSLIIPKVSSDALGADFFSSLDGDLRDQVSSTPLSQADVSSLEGAASIIHKVLPGETIGAIAKHYDLSQRSLVSLNRLADPDVIRDGQELVIPLEDLAPLGNSGENPARGGSMVVALPVLAADDRNSPLRLVDKPTPLSPVGKSRIGDRLLEHDVAVSQPDERLAAASEPLQIAIHSQNLSASAASSSSPYVENLMAEIRALADQYREDSATVQMPAQSSELVASSSTDLGVLDLQPMPLSDSVNPEFIVRDEVIPTEQVVSQSFAQASETRESSEASERSSVEVATAPLGSQNYRLSEPITGRMVSPDLPPMPGPENYLPEGSPVFNGYLWPARGVLTSGYGWRWGRMHQGIDIAAPVGTPVFAAASGVIEFSGWNSGGYGNMVDIRHPDGSKTRYAHNSRNLVRVGQAVEQGQQIALMGSTGYSTGPHVHFEVHLPNRGTVNPVALLPNR